MVSDFNHPLLIIIGFLPLGFGALWSKFEGVGSIGLEKQAPKIIKFCKKGFFVSFFIALGTYFLTKGIEYTGIFSLFFYISLSLLLLFIVEALKSKTTFSQHAENMNDWKQFFILNGPIGYTIFFLFSNLFVP